MIKGKKNKCSALFLLLEQESNPLSSMIRQFSYFSRLLGHHTKYIWVLIRTTTTCPKGLCCLLSQSVHCKVDCCSLQKESQDCKSISQQGDISHLVLIVFPVHLTTTFIFIKQTARSRPAPPFCVFNIDKIEGNCLVLHQLQISAITSQYKQLFSHHWWQRMYLMAWLCWKLLCEVSDDEFLSYL